MQTKQLMHTPGPWHIGTRSGFNASQIKSHTSPTEMEDPAICEVYGLPSNTTLSEVEGMLTGASFRIPGINIAMANARLIAAAPELLEALINARRFLTKENADIEFIDNAINKATGN